jgi:3',5'-cyclic AMP phosphodiesterase CpdA
MDAATLPPAPRSGTLRLAHLSDAHLTSLEGVGPGRLRDKRLLGWLSWRRRRRFRHRSEVLDRLVAAIEAAGVDHLAVTGDLTHIGLPEEIDVARAWLESLGAAEDVTLVPGNHDLYVADAAGTMQRAWAPWMRGDDGGGFPFVRLRGATALIGLDSARPSAPLLATGRLGEAQIAALDDVLARTGAAGYARIVLVHHAPLPGGDPHRKRLVDAAALTDVLRRRGAELVLHGHGHSARIVRLETERGIVPVVQAPSASAMSRRPGHRAAWMDCTVDTGDDGVEVHVRPQDLDGRPTEAHAFGLPRPA